MLTIHNTKTLKSASYGYLTGVLHLAPYVSSGFQVCPMAEVAGCWKGCLNTAGRGGMSKGNAEYLPLGGSIPLPDNAAQRARVRKTRLFATDRGFFLEELAASIKRLCRRAEKLGLKPAVRLNGTSDIIWEKEGSPTLLERFPDVQFYDYTKILGRKSLPNYHLTYSYSQASLGYARAAFVAAKKTGGNLAVVFRGKLPETFLGRRVIDGDVHDLRFLDPAGVVVGLKAKGRAKNDQSGFVIDV